VFFSSAPDTDESCKKLLTISSARRTPAINYLELLVPIQKLFTWHHIFFYVTSVGVTADKSVYEYMDIANITKIVASWKI
jgi:hypothetical protein